MKLQTISLIFIIVIYQIVGQLHELTPEENVERLRTCGKEFLPTPSPNEYEQEFNYYNKPSWLLWTSLNNDTQKLSIQSTAFPISKRHVFTSAQLVLTLVADNPRKWTVNGELFNQTICKNADPRVYTDLPKHVVDSLLVISGNKTSYRVLNGRIFSVCADNFHILSSPLLLEVQINLPFEIPCLADEATDDREGNEGSAYGLNWAQMMHHRVKIQEDTGDPRWVYTTKYHALNDRGGPLVLNNSNKATVVGLKASGTKDNSEGVYFFSMKHFQEEICNFSGVCQILPTTPAPTTTTLDPPTTSEVTIPDPLNTQNPEKKPESPAPKPSGKTTKKPIKQKWKKTFEYVNEEDQKDSRLTMFVGDGEWNGAGTMNFLLVLMMVLRV